MPLKKFGDCVKETAHQKHSWKLVKVSCECCKRILSIDDNQWIHHFYWATDNANHDVATCKLKN
jgi:hypothetical protein